MHDIIRDVFKYVNKDVKTVIEVVGLTKKYGSRLALNNISFNVDKGEIVGFLGPNGAGKSTTMNILTGYISASSGEVKIDGIDILQDPINAKKKIGYLPENPPLYMDMKVREYLDFVFDLKKVKIDKKSHIAEICDLVQITDVYERVIKNLSKGYRQRVGLAQALIGSPELLILDEPTVGLDPKQIIDIRNLIKRLGETHTVILSSHILPEIQAVCDKVIIINKGEIVANEHTDVLTNKISYDNKILLDVVGDEKTVCEAVSKLEDVENIEKLNKENNDENQFSCVITTKGGKDIRKDLSKAVTDTGSVIIGLKLSILTLEEIFLKLTDTQNNYQGLTGENLDNQDETTEKNEDELNKNENKKGDDE